MTDTSSPAPQDLPAFTGCRLLYAATGALTAAHTPFWVNWIRLYYPEVSVRMMVTRSAERFVTQQALASLSSTDVMVDDWPDAPAAQALHVELTEWADTFIVAPATLGFCSRLAAGLTDSPLLLALQCTRAPVALAPSLPPGGLESVAYRRAMASIQEFPHITVIPPVPGLSSTTGRWDATINSPMPAVFAAAEALRTEMAATEPGGRP